MEHDSMTILETVVYGFKIRQCVITVDVVSSALLFYDYLLTFPMELEVIWSSNSTEPTYLISSTGRSPTHDEAEEHEMASRNSFGTITGGSREIWDSVHSTGRNSRAGRARLSNSLWKRISERWGKVRRWGNLSRILFLLARYPVFLGSLLEVFFETKPGISFPACRSLVSGIALTRAIGLAVAEAIFTLRTLAVYSNARQLRKVLLGFYIIFVTAVVATYAFFIGLMKDIPLAAHLIVPVDFPGCLVIEPQVNFILISFVCVMVYEAVLASLMLYHVYRSYQEDHTGSSTLFRVIYQDAILFYIALLVISVLNVLTIIIPSVMSYSLIHFQLVMHAILACRSMLHIRAEVVARCNIESYKDDDVDHRCDSIHIIGQGELGKAK